mgnify:FL=1
MNDDFLYINRPDPDPNFTKRLNQRWKTGFPEKENIVNPKKTIQFSVWQVALSALLITTILLLVFSAPVRAKAIELIRSVAGFNIREQGQDPVMQITDQPGFSPTSYPHQELEVPDLLKSSPFEIAFPTWVPEGYILDQTIALPESGDWMLIRWENPDLSSIGLMVEKEYNGWNIPAGEGSTEEISINGQPAFLIRGAWDSDHQWDPDRKIEIGWEQNGRFYRLSFTQTEPVRHEMADLENVDEKIDILIKMAESFQPLPQ